MKKENAAPTHRHEHKRSGVKAEQHRSAQRATAGIRMSRKVRAQQVEGFQVRTRVQVIDPTEVAETFERTPEDYEIVGGAVEQAAEKTCLLCGRKGHRGFKPASGLGYVCSSETACAKRSGK